MNRTFKKGDNIATYDVVNGRVNTVIQNKDNGVTINPTLEDFLAMGWEEYVEPSYVPEPTYTPTLEELVLAKIRERYTEEEELKIHRLMSRYAIHTELDIPDEYVELFDEYDDYVEQCIDDAHKELEI